MDEETQARLLREIPGAKRAADGVILEGQDGSQFHIFNVRPLSKTEGLTQEEQFFTAFCSKKEIIRLRSIKISHDYLLRIRAMAIVDSARAVRVMNSRRSKFEQTNRTWSLTEHYHSYDHFHKSYLSLLPNASLKRLAPVPAGIAPLLEPNAMCIRTFVGDIIVVSESLSHFYYFMTIGFFGQNFDIAPQDRAHALLIATRIMNGAEALDFDIDSRGALPSDIERKIRALVNFQMMFTYGHEYAHYLLDHLATSETEKTATSGSEMSNKEVFYSYSHTAEFDADFHAVNNSKASKEKYNGIAKGGLQALLFTSYLDEVRSLIGIKRTATSETHPKSIDRFWALQNKLGTNSPIPTRVLKEWENTMHHLINIGARAPLKSQKDIFTFYGSVYLPSYVEKLNQDRRDF
jgi:hypothetical protein